MNAKERRGTLLVAIVALLLIGLGVWLQCDSGTSPSTDSGEKLYQQISSTETADSTAVSSHKKSSKKRKSKKGGKSSKGSASTSRKTKEPREIDVLDDTLPVLYD